MTGKDKVPAHAGQLYCRAANVDCSINREEALIEEKKKKKENKKKKEKQKKKTGRVGRSGPASWLEIRTVL